MLWVQGLFDKGVFRTKQKVVSLDDDISNLPDNYYLLQNYPNPFNPVTTISFSLPLSGHVKLMVYNITSKLVEVLVDEYKAAGQHEIEFSAENLASGVYLYKLENNRLEKVKKMLLIK